MQKSVDRGIGGSPMRLAVDAAFSIPSSAFPSRVVPTLSIEVLHSGGLYAERLVQYFAAFGASVTSQVLTRDLPLIVDDVDEYLPPGTGHADVVIAVNMHQDLLVGLPELMAGNGGRALIVPIEDPDWARPGLVRQVEELCHAKGIECSFPKPFCGLVPETPIIKRFCEEYRVGRPLVQLTAEDGVITGAECLRGAPCGLTAWAVPQLVGKACGDEALASVHSLQATFPCLATMVMDHALGDTVMHLSVGIMYEGIQDAIKQAARS